jgi:hypothetical protein
MTPKKLALGRGSEGGSRFSACAKWCHPVVVLRNAAAGEGRSDKMMRKKQAN